MNNEPVAWMLTLPDGTHDWILNGSECEGYIPLYTHPHSDNFGFALSIIDQQKLEIERLKAKTPTLVLDGNRVYPAFKTLTDEEILSEWNYEFGVEVDLIEFARAILKKAQE